MRNCKVQIEKCRLRIERQTDLRLFPIPNLHFSICTLQFTSSRRVVGLLLLMALITTEVGCENRSGKSPPVSLPVAVDKSLLKGVEDKIEAVDAPGYYALLDHAGAVSATDLEKAGVKVAYVDLMAHPEQFRGDPITIQGVLWRLYELPGGRDRELKTLYEAWIVTGDSQPYRVVFSRLMPEFVPGQKLRTVQVTGYFFLLERNETSEERWIEDLLYVSPIIVVAPTLLAQRITSSSDPIIKTSFETGGLEPPVLLEAKDINLPDIKVGLHSDKDGTLARLMLGGNNLGNDDDAFERLNEEILQIIGRPGNPLVKDLAVEIDADFECQYKYVAKAIVSCSGRFHPQTGRTVRYIEKFKFALPHNPK